MFSNKLQLQKPQKEDQNQCSQMIALTFIGYDQYSFGIGIGFADKEYVLLTSADTDFFIGFSPIG